MRKTAIFVPILLCCMLSFVFNGCATHEPPLHIRDIRVSPQPVIGKSITMLVEVENRNNQDYDNIVFELLPSSGILLLEGQTSQIIAMKQGERKTLSIPICVTQEGEQKIHLWVSIPISEQSRMTDGDLLRITIYGQHSYAVPSRDYFAPAPTPPGYQLPTPGTVTCEDSGS
jgi:hypothetical protein